MFTQAELDAVKAEVKREVEEAITFAQESPEPKPEEALEDMFSAA
jgi:pyruvate dehydrogenase E1 component alpha subunit